ncbi:hypothetical protein KAU93_05255 [Candidatus Bathyarchaeota archaeon]|nr:hypothetical protein [Candidatus Bathyarchaeota archaeon]
MRKARTYRSLVHDLHSGIMLPPEKYPHECCISSCSTLVHDRLEFYAHLFYSGGHNLPKDVAMKIVNIYNPDVTVKYVDARAEELGLLIRKKRGKQKNE